MSAGSRMGKARSLKIGGGEKRGDGMKIPHLYNLRLIPSGFFVVALSYLLISHVDSEQQRQTHAEYPAYVKDQVCHDENYDVANECTQEGFRHEQNIAHPRDAIPPVA